MQFVRKWAGLIALVVLVSFALLRVPRGAAVLAVIAAGAGLFWLQWAGRKHGRHRAVKSEAEAEPLPSRPRAPALADHSLEHVDDVRLAAVILMIQLVRTSAPLRAAGRTLIYDLMADPLDVEGRHAMFEQAWQLTDRGLQFSPMADGLVPLFMARLTLAERLDFIDMLTRIAHADGEPSELQIEAIARLKKRLTAGVEELGPAGNG
jgi:uncharacterized tellurite resistance protein B-like protein